MSRNNRVLTRIWLGGDTQCYYGSFPDAAKAVHGLVCISFPGAAAPGFSDYMRNEVTPWKSQNPWLRKYWEMLFGCSWKVTNNTNVDCNDYQSAQERIQSATFYSGKVWDGVHAYAVAIHNIISKFCPNVFEEQDQETLDNCITGPRILQNMKTISMEGVIQRIQFDDDGGLVPHYLLNHHVYNEAEDTYSRVKVGDWLKGDSEGGDLSIDLSLLQWNNLDFGNDSVTIIDANKSVVVPVSVCSEECGPKQYKIRLEQKCCWNCHDCQVNGILVENSTSCEICPEYTWPDVDTITRCEVIPVTYLSFADTSGIALAVMAALGSVGCVIILGLFHQKRNTKLIKATNKQLTMLMLFGGTLACALVFVFMEKPSALSCGVRQIGFHLTVSLLYCPLFIKTSRIYRIFSAGKKGINRPRLISSGWQVVLTTSAIGMQVS